MGLSEVAFFIKIKNCFDNFPYAAKVQNFECNHKTAATNIWAAKSLAFQKLSEVAHQK